MQLGCNLKKKIEILKNVLINIGYFYVDQYKDQYKYEEELKDSVNIHELCIEVYNTVRKLEITNIDYKKSFGKHKIHIHLGKPGLLLGLRGRNIKLLEKYLSIEIFNSQEVKIYCEEDRIYDYLFSFLSLEGDN